LTNLGDVEQLVKFPVGVGGAHKDSSSRRVGFSSSLGSALAWCDAFRDGKPRRPISKTPTNTDPVVCHVQQMLETRQFDKKGIPLHCLLLVAAEILIFIVMYFLV
jgi:hypothetical protein